MMRWNKKTQDFFYHFSRLYLHFPDFFWGLENNIARQISQLFQDFKILYEPY